MKFNSGELNQKITIVRFEDVDDGAGGSYPNSVPYWSTFAKVTPIRSGRTLEANQERLIPAMKFEVRDRRDKFVIEDMKIEYRGAYYQVISAIPDYTYWESLVIIATASNPPKR